MPFTTSHTESGEGVRNIRQALERSLQWLDESEPGNALMRWRITMSFKETDKDAVENDSARRTGKLFDTAEAQVKRGRRRRVVEEVKIEDETA